MRRKRFFKQTKTWIALALVAVMIATPVSVRATFTPLEGNEDTTLPTNEVDTVASDIKEENTTTSVKDDNKIAPRVNEYTPILSKLEQKLPTSVGMPLAGYALSELLDAELETQSVSYLYNMEKLQTEVILFRTTLKTTFTTSSDSGTIPANSTMELGAPSPITEIGFLGFDTTKIAPGTKMEIFVNNDSTPFYNKEITDENVTVKLPKDALIYKVHFTNDIYTSSKKLSISTYASINMNTPPTGNETLIANVDLTKAGGNIQKKYEDTFIDIAEPIADGFIQGDFYPKNGSVASPDDLKKSPNVEYEMNYSFNYRNVDGDFPIFIRLKDTEFQSHADEDMILKKLVINKEFSGRLGDGFDASTTYDLYINDALVGKDLSILKEQTFEFNDTIHREFKIVIHDDSTQVAIPDRSFPKALSAVYECKGDGTKGAYPIYIEGKTGIGNNIFSSLDPIVSADSTVKGIQTYFLHTPFFKNESTKKVHSVGEDIVFNLTNVYASKFIGDYGFNYLTFDTSTNLKEYYYLKQVDLVPIVRPKAIESISPIEFQLYEDATKNNAEGGKISDNLYTYTNNNETFSSSQLSGICLKPGVRSINRDMLKSDAYDYFVAVCGMDMSDFTVKLTYAPRTDKTITENTIFTNNVTLATGPTNNPFDPAAKNGTISGTTEIRVTTDPGTDNPGTDNPGTDNPGTDNPGTDNPGTDNPGTDNPGTDNPGTNNPGTNNPGTNNPGTNNPGPSDSGNQQSPIIDSSNKDSHDPVNGNKPDTGDNTSFGLWFLVSLFTGAGILCCCNTRIKTRTHVGKNKLK